MEYILENKDIKITAVPKGAELSSILGKKENTEFLWNGDPLHWGGRSPVLFPAVGKSNEGHVLVNGVNYDMPKHGFARNKDFTLEYHDENELSFLIKSDAETMKVYPFEFIFRIKYEIEANSIIVTYIAENTGMDTMYFGLGGHPGFMCPMLKGEQFTDYYLEFNKKENAPIMTVTSEGLFSHETRPMLQNENKINLNYDLFLQDALVFYNLESDTIFLKSVNHSKQVEVNFEGYKYLGVWTKNDAPFICIEPWHNHADFEDFSGELKDKKDIIVLSAGKVFTSRFIITITE